MGPLAQIKSIDSQHSALLWSVQALALASSETHDPPVDAPSSIFGVPVEGASKTGPWAASGSKAETQAPAQTQAPSFSAAIGPPSSGQATQPVTLPVAPGAALAASGAYPAGQPISSGLPSVSGLGGDAIKAPSFSAPQVRLRLSPLAGCQVEPAHPNGLRFLSVCV
jgi:hypothetical protein